MRTLHDATFDQQREEHEHRMQEIQKELPIRDSLEYFKELESLAEKYGIQLPDPKSQNNVDEA